MSLLSVLFPNYDKNCIVLSSEFVRSQLESHPLFHKAKIYLKDGDYIGLRFDHLKEFVADKIWTTTKKYKPEVFDCDDFAACARVDIIKASDALDFGETAFVAEVCYERAEGGYHAANLLMDSEGVIYLFEPQTGELGPISSRKVDYVGEVWG